MNKNKNVSVSPDDSTTQVVKAVYVGSEIEEHSKQLKLSSQAFANTGAIEPPYNPVTWGGMSSFSTRLAKCINTYVMNTVGFGWSIVVDDEAIKHLPDKEDVQRRVRRQTEALRSVLEKPNPEDPFTEVIKRVALDEESTGNGYLEVVRNLSGKPAYLYHAPASVTRIRKGGGFVQDKSGKKRYFKAFGDPRIIDLESGKVADGNLPFEKRASEIIHFRIYSSSSPYYGVPRYVSAVTAVSGNRLSAERNVNFFKNNAVPPFIVMVSGGALSAKSVQNIRDFMNADQKGSKNAHRAMVIQSETSGVAGALGGSGPKIELKELGVGSKDDASFMKYRESNDEEIRESFGIAEIFLGTTKDITKGNAIEARRVTNDQEFKPAKRSKEYRLQHTIVADIVSRTHTMDLKAAQKRFIGADHEEILKGFSPLEAQDELKWAMERQGYELEKIEQGQVSYIEKPIVKIQFNQPEILDPKEEAEVDKVYGDLAALTINELRGNIKREPLPHKWANFPYPILLHSDPVVDAIEQLLDNSSEGAGPEVQEIASSLKQLRSKMLKVING